MKLCWTKSQPLGVGDLEPHAATRYRRRASQPLTGPNGVRCCRRDCTHWLAKRKKGRGDDAMFCREHGITVSLKPTYIYRDYRNNFIVNVPLLEEVKKLKVESWRLGYERSEDAVSWNVFVSLAGLGSLAAAFRALTGRAVEAEPELYLWGVRVDDAEPRRWDRLMAVRGRLEREGEIPTEPDIMLRVPGVALVLIEAKFGSPNGTLKGHKKRFGGVSEFLGRYPGPEGRPDPLDRAWIEAQPYDRVLQQLVRNIVFAQWLAADGEEPWVVNLVRGAEELDVEQRITPHLAPGHPVRFRRRTWEDLCRLPVVAEPRAGPLRQYLDNKTIGLVKAFTY
jgi:hypothetical protein